MAAHLAGAVSANTVKPVIGIPIDVTLNGLDALLSTVMMPGGIPVATVAIGKAGAKCVVSHQHRYGVHYRKVKEIIDSGVLGRVHTVYGSATGWMTHMLSHLIEYTRWYNGEAEAAWPMAHCASGYDALRPITASTRSGPSATISLKSCRLRPLRVHPP